MSKIYDSSIIGKKQSVVDEILLLNPHQTPLINMLGFSDPVTQTSHQWFEDEMYGDESTVVGAKLVTDTTIVVADAEPFRPEHIVKIGEELLLVTAVDAGTKTLTVTRGYAGTTAAAISNGALIEVQFVKGEEGADARTARYKQRKKVENITQIIDETVTITGTAQAVAQYGITDLYEYEKQKKQLELALQLEKALINGILYEDGETRYMKGVRQFIQTNVVNVGGAISMDAINNLAQDIYVAGGFKTAGNYKVIAGAKQKRKISALDTNKVQITRGENSRGEVVDLLINDFGEFEIALNDNLAPDEVLFVDTNRMAIRPLIGRDFFHTYMGVKGDYTTGTLVGEYTLEFKQEKAHGRLKGLN